MSSRTDYNRLRSVPLIQRDDMARQAAMDSRRREMSPADERRPRREERSSRLSRNATSDFGDSRLPAGTHVSAHMGESSVVSVKRRSERRSGFSLVTDDTPVRSRGTETVEPAYQGVRIARSTASYERGQTRRRSYVVDDYDEEAYEAPRSRGHRVSLADVLLAIPRAIASGAMGILSHVNKVGLLVMIVAALTVVMLYAPARDLYQANRKLDELQATYDVLLAENEAIRSELEYLQTREGIEDEARARGYVEPGEVKVMVNGLPEEEATSVIDKISSDVELPDTRPWYVRMFDKLFGYEPGE